MFRLDREAELCAGTLVARRFVVELSAEGEEQLAYELARAYVAPHRYVADPDALVGPRLPTADKARKGDLGEFLTHRLYEHVFGHEIPFSRLWSKTAPNATQQGADTVSVLIDPTSNDRPFTVETKVRTGSTGSGDLLAEISSSIEVTKNNEYLAAAWGAGLDKLDAHRRARTAYAYTAAHHLALLDGTKPEELPPYERHAVIITDGADIKGTTIESHWSPPPVAALTIVKIPGLNGLIARLYAKAGAYTAGQLLGTTTSPVPFPPAIEDPAGWVGLRSPLDPQALADWIASNPEPHPAIEAALWYLAGHDGIARARALKAEHHGDPGVLALVQLLLGRDKAAIATAQREGLSTEPLLRTISEVLESPGALASDRDRIVETARGVLLATDRPSESMAINLTVEAVCHRLRRQPARMLTSAGVGGPRVKRIANVLYQHGIHALWPSQSQALDAGLLSSPPRPFVLRVPTSGGKTTLIALAAANALDHRPGSRVVVLAPSRALVNQLRSDLRRVLGPIQVLALHGELELGDEVPSDEGDLVTVMTPERFDLDWRRSVTIDELEPIEDSISAVIVDEAHYVANQQRGARLELALSRVLRAGIPVTLASSQLGQLELLATWVEGGTASTEWQPAHHIRQVYFRTNDNRDDGSAVIRGVLCDETRRLEWRLTIGQAKDRQPQSDLATANVGDQGAAIATQFEQDGPVVLFSATKRSIPNLVRHLYSRVADSPPHNVERLEELARPLPDDAAEERKLLLAGIGVHHRDVRQRMRTIVEAAAREGALRYLVCTSTLLEGVDFPTRTVVMVYPQHSANAVSVGDLLNLEGRAGRGGQHTNGRIVVFNADETSAMRRLQLFQRQLPATTSQIARAANLLRRRAADAQLDDLEAFLLAAIAEAALDDGDLRKALERILGRSLHFAALDDIARDETLAAATVRAAQIRQANPGPWPSVVYRTGLRMATCEQIRTGLSGLDLSAVTELGQEIILAAPSLSPLEVLTALIADVLIDVAELGWPTIEGLDPSEVVHGWLSGISAESIPVPEGCAATGDDVQRCFDAVARHRPWLVGAAVEIAGHMSGLDHASRIRFHSALELDRLRTGTPSLEASALVAGGFEREDATELWCAHQAATSSLPFAEWVEQHLSDDPTTIASSPHA